MSIRIALAGNPNSGKTTMFNDLTGSSQYVGNWPGVTVEKKEGKYKGDKTITIIDLPGIYSLSPYTLEEVVTREYLLNERPDVIINVVDGTNLERNLYLTTQLVELGIPVVLALNMMDLVKKNGDQINVQQLSKALGCQVVETSALKGQGGKAAVEKAISVSKEKKEMTCGVEFSSDLESVISGIMSLIRKKCPVSTRWYAIKIFERDEKVLADFSPAEKAAFEDLIDEAETQLDDDSESIVTNERYEWITAHIAKFSKRNKKAMTTSDKIDRIVTNRILAFPIFAAVMFIVYYISVTTVGDLVTGFTNDTLFGAWIQPGVTALLENAGAAVWLISLIVDGIIGGVGAILGFVPQMLVLFFFLAILEDCGYMARIAFIMDRIFRRFGLSGKSFIPLLIGSGCSVPGIMASKTIENEKDRRMTIITTSFIPCSAKMPIIALVMGSMLGTEMGGWVAPLFYFLGIAVVILSAIILKKTKLFAGDPAPFVMELPQYHVPTAKGVLIHMWERGKSFIIKAGTIIFVASAVIWFLQSFGWGGTGFGYIGGENQDNSVLAKIGGGISWFFAPLGFGQWQAAVSSITGLVAKEVVVTTFGILFGLGEVAEDDPGLWASFGAMLPAAYQQMSFIAFNLLCAPCFAAIGAIRREMASAKWTWFAVCYQTALAYAVALMINQFGALFVDGIFGAGTVAAIVVLLVLLFLLLRPDPNKARSKMKRTASANL